MSHFDFAIHAEDVGFDSIMVSDHFQPCRHTGGHPPFSLAWLGALWRWNRIGMGKLSVLPSSRLSALPRRYPTLWPSITRAGARASASASVIFSSSSRTGLISRRSLRKSRGNAAALS